MRWSSLLATFALAFVALPTYAQSGRYGLPAPETSRPPSGSELPFDSRDLAEGFDAADLSATQQLTPLDTQAPVQARPTQVPQAQTAPAQLPQTQAPTTPYGVQPQQPPRTYTGDLPSAPTGATSPAARTDYAESLISAALAPPQGSQLQGSKTLLSDVIALAGDRSRQSESIAAYWDLCSAVADYYLSLHEQGELERLIARSGPASPPLREAVTKLKTRRDTALTAARASQLRLAALIGRGQPMPLPGDMPLCTVYHTRYSQNFQNGESQEAAELNRLLPLRHAELLDAATAVGEAEDWFNEVTRRAANDQGAGVVKALELLALNRRAFVQISRDYNKRISRYTELARPGDLRAERLVAMLIKTNSVASRPSSPPAPGGRRSSQADPPSTFREDGAWAAEAAAPRLDPEVLPTGSVEEQSMVEKITPAETSVLIRGGR